MNYKRRMYQALKASIIVHGHPSERDELLAYLETIAPKEHKEDVPSTDEADSEINADQHAALTGPTGGEDPQAA